MKDPSERPPRVGLKLALRALLACTLVMVLTGAAVATAALRELDDILDPIRQPGRADIEVPELDNADAGRPAHVHDPRLGQARGRRRATARRGRTRSCSRAPTRTRTRSP